MDLFRILINRILRKIPLKLLLLIIIFLVLGLVCFNAKSFAVDDITTIDINTALNSVLDYHMQTLSLTEPSYYIIDTYSSGTTQMVIITFLKSTNAYAWADGSREIYYIVGGNFCQYSCTASGNYTNVSVAYNNWNNSNNASPSRFTTTYNNFDIRYYSGGQGIYKYKNSFIPPITSPYISNTSEIDDMSFNYLLIEGGDEHYYREENGQTTFPKLFNLELDFNGVTYTMNINNYAVFGQNNPNVVAFAIPKNQLFPQLILRNDDVLSFSLFVDPSSYANSTGTWSIYDLGTYTLTLTTVQEEQLQEDRQAQAIENMNQSINNVNTSVNNLNTSINDLSDSVTDSSVDDMSSTFSGLSSGFSVQDPSGLEQVFQKLYNAFCTDEVINLTFTIPFTNRSVTISSANISARYPESITSIVSVFVWGIVGLWVLKDIRTIVNKISEGKAEDVGSDVKKEVL